METLMMLTLRLNSRRLGCHNGTRSGLTDLYFETLIMVTQVKREQDPPGF